MRASARWPWWGGRHEGGRGAAVRATTPCRVPWSMPSCLGVCSAGFGPVGPERAVPAQARPVIVCRVVPEY